ACLKSRRNRPHYWDVNDLLSEFEPRDLGCYLRRGLKRAWELLLERPVGTEAEMDPDAGGGTDETRRMRSQSALNLPPEVPWPEPVDGRTLLDELRDFLRRVVVLPMWAAEILALWIVHTYAFELRQVATYIGIESPKRRCGKTTLMTLLSELVNRPEPAANISSPAFYRAIEELRPTLLIDEADTLLPGNAQLRGILNSGYTREMAYVLRVTNDPLKDSKGRKIKGGSRLARYSCWGPKAIAQIGHLPATLRSRCIIIPMQKKMPEESGLPRKHIKGHKTRSSAAELFRIS